MVIGYTGHRFEVLFRKKRGVMEFVDLQTQFKRIEEDVLQRVERVIRNQRFIQGPEVFELESHC